MDLFRQHRTAIVHFVWWAIGGMMVVSSLYGVAYLIEIPFAMYPRCIAITVLYGLCMAGGVIASTGVLWIAVLAIRRVRPFAEPGLIATAIATCAGVNLGVFPGEYIKGALAGYTPTFTPLMPFLVEGWYIGLAFLFVRRSADYAARYRRIKRVTADSQRHVLASQLGPHFLFNALNSLIELIETDARQGAETAHRLSELLRQISRCSLQPTHSLAAEIAIIKEYLAIEHLRLGDRLGVELADPPWASTVHVPTLMVQTLVENAIKHGIAPSPQGGELRITFTLTDDQCECVVANTGVLLAPSAPLGVGLLTTRQRLAELYGSECALELRIEANGWTRAAFRVTGRPFCTPSLSSKMNHSLAAG